MRRRPNIHRILRTLIAGILLCTAQTGLCGQPAAAELPAKGKLLVAARDMQDPNFAQTVVLLLHYDDEGAMGLIINRPTQKKAAALMADLGGFGSYEGNVYLGGPVARFNVLGLFRAQESTEEADNVFGDIHWTGSLELLMSQAKARASVTDVRFYVGHAGWGPDQLDYELAMGGWHLAAASADFVFSAQPELIWEQLLPPQPVLTAGQNQLPQSLRAR